MQFAENCKRIKFCQNKPSKNLGEQRDVWRQKRIEFSVKEWHNNLFYILNILNN